MADSKLLEKARDCVKKKNYEYAIVNYITHLTTNPADIVARKELRDAERAQKKAGGGGGFMAKKMAEGKAAVLRVNAKDPEKTMLACEEILKTDPEVIGALLKLGEAAAAANHIEVAVQAFEDALMVDKENKEALRLMGRVFYNAEQLDRSLKCFQRLAKLDPKDKEAEENCKNIPASMTAKKVKEGVDKGGYQNLIDKGEANKLEKANKRVRTPEEALERIAELEPEVKKNPKDVKTMRLIAELYVKAEQPEKAVAWCDKAIAADPNDFLCSELKGDLMLKQHEKLVAQLSDAARKGDEKAKARLQKAKQDKLAFEVEEFKKRAEAHPTEYGLRYVLGKALYDSDRIDEAIVELQKAKQDARKKGEAGFYLGQCFVKKKIFKLALQELLAAREGMYEMDDTKKDITYLVARIYEQAGKKEEAVKEYNAIAEVDFGYKDVTKRLEALS